MKTLQQALAQGVEEQKEELARLIVDEQWRRNPGFEARYGAAGHAKCVQDVQYNLAYLAQAIAADSPTLFAAYLGWVKTLFHGLNIPTRELIESLDITGSTLQQRFRDSSAPVIAQFIETGLQHLREAPESLPSVFDKSKPFSALAQEYLQTLRHAERSAACQLIMDAIEQGTSIQDIYLHVFQPSQHEIGRLWQMNQLSVAEEHYCTAATQMIMSQLYSRIINIPKRGWHMMAACVGNELHAIGMHMVADFFEMEGWHTYYLGANTPTTSLLRTIRERQPDVLAISATMTFHVAQVKQLIEQVRALEQAKEIKILAGGYPFNIEPGLWQQVGADGYAPDAEQAVRVANAWMQARR